MVSLIEGVFPNRRRLNVKHLRLLFALVAILTLAAAACTTEVVKEVPVEKIVTVEKEVIKEVEVPGETVVVEKEVVRTRYL